MFHSVDFISVRKSYKMNQRIGSWLKHLQTWCYHLDLFSGGFSLETARFLYKKILFLLRSDLTL